tara:strand:- start:143 stop:436 length:294 start_codon:yes stop_codon:yes gene_type:complete
LLQEKMGKFLQDEPLLQLLHLHHLILQNHYCLLHQHYLEGDLPVAYFLLQVHHLCKMFHHQNHQLDQQSFVYLLLLLLLLNKMQMNYFRYHYCYLED